MIDLSEQIQNFNILSVLDLSWEHMDRDAEARPYHALSYRVRGNALFQTGEHTVSAGTGDLVFVPKNLKYHITGEKEILYCIHFTCDGLSEACVQRFTPASSLAFETLFRAMHKSWSEKKTGYFAGTSAEFFRIIEKIQTTQLNQENRDLRDHMNDAIEYLHEHFTESGLTIGELANIAGSSESYFRRQFKERQGISPLQYINNLRMKYACELMDSHYYKVYEVAEKAGFNDPKYFSTVMRKHLGSSPRTWLQTLKQNESGESFKKQ